MLYHQDRRGVCTVLLLTDARPGNHNATPILFVAIIAGVHACKCTRPRWMAPWRQACSATGPGIAAAWGRRRNADPDWILITHVAASQALAGEATPKRAIQFAAVMVLLLMGGA